MTRDMNSMIEALTGQGSGSLQAMMDAMESQGGMSPGMKLLAGMWAIQNQKIRSKEPQKESPPANDMPEEASAN